MANTSWREGDQSTKPSEMTTHHIQEQVKRQSQTRNNRRTVPRGRSLALAFALLLPTASISHRPHPFLASIRPKSTDLPSSSPKDAARGGRSFFWGKPLSETKEEESTTLKDDDNENTNSKRKMTTKQPRKGRNRDAENSDKNQKADSSDGVLDEESNKSKKKKKSFFTRGKKKEEANESADSESLEEEESPSSVSTASEKSSKPKKRFWRGRSTDVPTNDDDDVRTEVKVNSTKTNASTIITSTKNGTQQQELPTIVTATPFPQGGNVIITGCHLTSIPGPTSNSGNVLISSSIIDSRSSPTGGADNSGVSPGLPAGVGLPRPGGPGGGYNNNSSSVIVTISVLNKVIDLMTNIWILMLPRWTAKWIFNSRLRSLQPPRQHFVWERLNDKYVKDEEALSVVMEKAPIGMNEFKWKAYAEFLKRKDERELRKQRRLLAKKERDQAAKDKKAEGGSKLVSKPSDATTGNRSSHPVKPQPLFHRTVVVIDLGKVWQFDESHLEKVSSFLLTAHRSKAFGSIQGRPKPLEIVVIVESPGGEVSKYGLAASNLARLTAEEGITTTVCVDKIAASGGYMVASQAHKILAAPFATIGSIGVVMGKLNFHKLLKEFGVESVTIKAGNSKNPLSQVDEVSRADRAVIQKDVEKLHEAFRQLILSRRPTLASKVDEVFDGSVFTGSEALALNLVDGQMTSEEYILDRIRAGCRVLKIHRAPTFPTPQGMNPRLPFSFPGIVGRFFRQTKQDEVVGNSAGDGVANNILFSSQFLFQCLLGIRFLAHMWNKARS